MSNFKLMDLRSNLNLKYILLGFSLFLLAKSYFVWHNQIDTFALIGLCLYSLSFLKSITPVNLLFLIYSIFLFSWNSLFDNANIFGATVALMTPFILLIRRNVRIKVLDSFISIYIIVIAVSILVFIAVVFFNIGLPYSIIEPLNPIKQYQYSQYPFLVIPNQQVIDFPRFCGPFDEPGVVGTISGIVLAIYRKGMSKVRYVILLISGILSFSVFFFILFILSVAATNFKTIIASGVVFFVFFYFVLGSDVVETYILNRLEMTSDGSLKADNRTSESFDMIYDEFVNSSQIYFGTGNTDAGDGGSSYKLIIYNKGLIFFLLTFLFFALYAFKTLAKKVSLYLFFLVLIGMTYQRPYYFDPFYFFIFITIADKLRFYEEESLVEIEYGR